MPETMFRPNNLNDGFFSIDDFNKQSQFLEQHDARGEDDTMTRMSRLDADPLATIKQFETEWKIESRRRREEDDEDERWSHLAMQISMLQIR